MRGIKFSAVQIAAIREKRIRHNEQSDSNRDASPMAKLLARRRARAYINARTYG